MRRVPFLGFLAPLKSATNNAGKPTSDDDSNRPATSNGQNPPLSAGSSSRLIRAVPDGQLTGCPIRLPSAADDGVLHRVFWSQPFFSEAASQRSAMEKNVCRQRSRKPTATSGSFLDVQSNDFSQAIVTSGRNNDNPAITDTMAHAHCPLATCARLAHRKASACRVVNAGRECSAQWQRQRGRGRDCLRCLGGLCALAHGFLQQLQS